MQFNATVHTSRGPMVAMSGDADNLRTFAGILAAIVEGRIGESLDHPEYPGATVGDITEIELGVFVR